jgi:enterochelin esterase-like enzyme
MKQTFFMSLFLIAAMSLSACSKMSSLSSPIRNSSLTRMCRFPASGPSWEYGPVHKVVCSVLRSLGVDEPLWDDTIWNNPLPDNAYPGPVPIHGTYYSQSMNVNVGYNVLLPPEYDGSTRFPVIYMFGGGGSDENTYLVSGVEAGFNPDRSGFIIVYGNGSRDGKYYDAAPGSPLDGHQMVETTIIRELIPAIDRTFLTIPSREGRAMMGGSGGGQASLRLAFKYPEMFAAIYPVQAAIFPTAAKAFNALGDNVGYWMFNNDASYYEAGTPYTLAVQNADRIKSLGLGIHMQIGGDDGLLDNNQRLIQVLDSVGIPHEDLVIVPGVGHDWAAWGTDPYQWAKRYLSAPQPQPTNSCQITEDICP